MVRNMLMTPARPASSRRLVAQQKLVAMFRQLPNVLIFTFVSTSALAFYFYDHAVGGGGLLWLWWGAMQLLNLMRLAGFVWWRRFAVHPVVNPERVMCWFAMGALFSGALWASFTITYFTSASQPQRLVIALVMSAIAAGSVNVLALMPWVNRLFIALLITPLVVLFAQSGAMDDLVVAGLGVVLFVCLTGFSRVSGDNLLGSLMVTADHNSKIATVFAQRDELMRAKDELEARVMRQISALQTEIELKERYAQELEKMASRDALTGLFNRTGFDEQLRQMLARARIEQEVVGLMAIEILHFDVIELQGSAVSNQVLLALADRLQNFLPIKALTAAWGGAEFYVAIEEADIEASEASYWNHYAALLQNVLKQPITTDAGAICVDALIGITRYPDLAINNELMFYQAAAARHSLRKLGVGGIKVFDPNLDASLKERYYLRQALHKAIDENALTLVFQPLVPSAKSHPYKMEALLRWDDAEFGPVSPVVFIPIAEESGLIVSLGRWVLSSACAAAAASWPNHCAVCVNVSIHQILAGDLVADIEAALHESELSPTRLEVEITESMFAQDMEYISSVLTRVQALGVSVAIDDFGTGYSSLAYLRRLPVNTIKIDRSFIVEIDQDARKLLFSIVTMARGLGFHIVAEGVETQQQQDLLLALGVDYLQGYLFSRPINLAASSDWLAALPEVINKPS